MIRFELHFDGRVGSPANARHPVDLREVQAEQGRTEAGHRFVSASLSD
jgi:hypothetical protein